MPVPAHRVVLVTATLVGLWAGLAAPDVSPVLPAGPPAAVALATDGAGTLPGGLVDSPDAPDRLRQDGARRDGRGRG